MTSPSARMQQAKGNGWKFTPGCGPAVPQTCPETGAGFQMGGPVWAEALHDPAWVAALRTEVQVVSVFGFWAFHSTVFK